MEGLLRWNRPGHGVVSPGEFIAFAERTDLIVDIDNWVIDCAAAQLREWESDDLLRSAAVAINISARHFASERFVANILDPLRSFGVDPSRLVIEVTESTLLDDLENAAEKLRTLQHEGIKIAIDDFGTGYTSLAYLRELPVDIIKIDRSFISDLSAESFVKLIIDTGHLIGAKITAEGVETEAQADRMRFLGCDCLQGFYFGYPEPPAVVVEAAGERVVAVSSNSGGHGVASTT